MILVTGSTGQLGRLVIEHLSQRVDPSEIVAGARDPEKARTVLPTDLSVRELDYDRPETIAAALDGVTRVLLISSSELGNRFAQHQRVIDAAVEAGGIQQFAYTSILNNSPEEMMLAQEHDLTERYLKESGLPFTLLRNGWYNENWAMSLQPTIENGVLYGSTGDGVVSPAARTDFAEAAAVVLTTDGHIGRTYELGGDIGYTSDDIASEISEVSGEPVTYQDLPEAQYAKALEGVGLPEAFAAILADSDTAIRKGILRANTDDLHGLIGRPTTPLAETFRSALADA